MEFTKDTFTLFCNILDSISKYCSDCEIKDGRIRIRSNNKAIMYDLELPFQLSLPISSVGNFVDILKIFQPDENNPLVLNITPENKIILHDKFTDIMLDLPILDVLQNRFVEDNALEQVGFFQKTEVFSTELPEVIFTRIKTVSKNFATSIITLNVDNGTAQITIRSESKTKIAKFNIPSTECKLEDGTYLVPFALIDFPFNTPLYFKIFRLSTENLLSCMHDSSYNIYSGVVRES